MHQGSATPTHLRRRVRLPHHRRAPLLWLQQQQPQAPFGRQHQQVRPAEAARIVRHAAACQ